MHIHPAFHVLAKITYTAIRTGLGAPPEQKHFFIHTSDEGRAVTLAKLALEDFKRDNPESQVTFTVKNAVQAPLAPSTSPDEEVYSI